MQMGVYRDSYWSLLTACTAEVGNRGGQFWKLRDALAIIAASLVVKYASRSADELFGPCGTPVFVGVSIICNVAF